MKYNRPAAAVKDEIENEICIQTTHMTKFAFKYITIKNDGFIEGRMKGSSRDYEGDQGILATVANRIEREPQMPFIPLSKGLSFREDGFECSPLKSFVKLNYQKLQIAWIKHDGEQGQGHGHFHFLLLRLLLAIVWPKDFIHSI